MLNIAVCLELEPGAIMESPTLSCALDIIICGLGRKGSVTKSRCNIGYVLQDKVFYIKFHHSTPMTQAHNFRRDCTQCRVRLSGIVFFYIRVIAHFPKHFVSHQVNIMINPMSISKFRKGTEKASEALPQRRPRLSVSLSCSDLKILIFSNPI